MTFAHIDDGDSRRSAADRWADIARRLEQIHREPEGPGERIRFALTRTRRDRQRQALAHELYRAESALTYAGGTGSNPHTWGVLSTSKSISLEATLRALTRPNASTAPALAKTLRTLARTVPTVRVRAEHGDQDSVDQLTAQLLDLTKHPDLDSDSREALTLHLPGSVRPLPASLDDLDTSRRHWRGERAVTLSVSAPGRRPYATTDRDAIWLHDIVVHIERSRGLGTAVLTQLIRFADHHGLPIAGELQPGPTHPAEHVTRLAHWYARHGFRHAGAGPDSWPRMAVIRREPNTQT